jgi:hypothetical protein
MRGNDVVVTTEQAHLLAAVTVMVLVARLISWALYHLQ